MDKTKAIKWLVECSRFFASRSTGEDSTYWANVYNAETATAIATYIESLYSQLTDERMEHEATKRDRLAVTNSSDDRTFRDGVMAERAHKEQQITKAHRAFDERQRSGRRPRQPRAKKTSRDRDH